LKLELRPDEEIEGGAGHIDCLAGVFGNRLAIDQRRRLFVGMSLLISQYVRMQLAMTTMKPSEKMALSAIFCLLGIA
jgi:hypothetical protein